MPITPDTKDWTWVLKRVCPECWFDVRHFPREQIGSIIRDNAAAWPGLLAHPDARRRPSEDVWSALEYGCHVRDVFRIYDERLRLMLDQANPLFANWNQDETAVERQYLAQLPEQVAAELRAGAATIADRFEDINDSQWKRTGTRSDGALFTIESLGRYLVHDPVHHVNDVEKGFRRVWGT